MRRCRRRRFGHFHRKIASLQNFLRFVFFFKTKQGRRLQIFFAAFFAFRTMMMMMMIWKQLFVCLCLNLNFPAFFAPASSASRNRSNGFQVAFLVQKEPDGDIRA